MSAQRDLPFTPSDGFILALDGFCRRAWGGCLSANTQVEIEGTPDRAKLERLARDLPRRLPMLNAVLRRGVVLQAPRWRLDSDAPAAPVPLAFHRLAEVEGDEPVVRSVAELRAQLLAQPLHLNGRPPHLRLDVVRHLPGRWLLLITWSHLLLDGVGIDCLVRTMARLWDDPEAKLPPHPPVPPAGSVWQRFQESEAVGKFLFHLSGKHFPSASEGRLAVGRPGHVVETFSVEETRHIRAVLQGVGGDLMAVFFYLVIAARAHRALLRHRGSREPTVVIGVPVQLRAKSDDGQPVIFQNHMTMLHYVFEDADLDDLRSACKLAMKQNLDHLRKKHHLSFHSFLSLMRHLPGTLAVNFVRWQQRGELSSLFHSWTGTFGEGLVHAFGGRLLNAFNVPGVSAPPGSGLFFSDCQDRATVVLSWVASCLNADEVAIMQKQWRHDLLGGR